MTIVLYSNRNITNRPERSNSGGRTGVGVPLTALLSPVGLKNTMETAVPLNLLILHCQQIREEQGPAPTWSLALLFSFLDFEPLFYQLIMSYYVVSLKHYFHLMVST